jgi:flagella basal body P-ring formation protein FlgA
LAQASSTERSAPEAQPTFVASQRAEDLLSRHAVAYLGDWLGRHADRYEVEPDPATMPSFTLPKGSVEVRVRPLPEGTRPSARMPLWLDVFIDGRPERSVLLASRVKAYRQAWTVNADLAAGTRLDPRFLHREEVDVAASGIEPWQGDPASAVLRTRLLRGAALTSANVAAAFAVSRGERVLASSRVGGIEVLAAAQALQDADVGQRIQVRVDAAKGPVLATVLEPGRVEIAQ